jgi:hypothetical protein
MASLLLTDSTENVSLLLPFAVGIGGLILGYLLLRNIGWNRGAAFVLAFFLWPVAIIIGIIGLFGKNKPTKRIPIALIIALIIPIGFGIWQFIKTYDVGDFPLTSRTRTKAEIEHLISKRDMTLLDFNPFVAKNIAGKEYYVTKAQVSMIVYGSRTPVVLGFIFDPAANYIYYVTEGTLSQFLQTGDSSLLPTKPDLTVH